MRVYDDDAARDLDLDLDEGEGGDGRLVCRDCREPITTREQAVCVDGDRAERVFFNPAGLVMRILTVRRARGLGLVGPAVSDFTWFAGFTWRIAICASCGQHLGWRYEAQAGGDPFWGLLLERLVDADQ